jgi:hypothetical protein
MRPCSKISSLKKKRKIFGWLFLVSILVFIAAYILLSGVSKESAPPLSKDTIHSQTLSRQSIQAQSASGPDTTVIVAIVSLLTSIMSLVGFFSTTVLAWRKEKRETVAAALEIKKQELELEKLRAELTETKKEKIKE